MSVKAQYDEFFQALKKSSGYLSCILGPPLGFDLSLERGRPGRILDGAAFLQARETQYQIGPILILSERIIVASVGWNSAAHSAA